MKLAEAALDNLLISGPPEKLIGGKAHDCGGLDGNLMKKQGVEMTGLIQTQAAKLSSKEKVHRAASNRLLA